MPRVKRGVTAHQHHKKVLSYTKGQRASRHNLFTRAHEAMEKSLAYSYAHRRERKGDMRRLWIVRLSAASRLQGLSYSQVIDNLKKAGVALNRKVLADMAVREPEALANLITMTRNQS